MTEVLERETSGQSDADTSVISMLDENEAQYSKSPHLANELFSRFAGGH